MRVPVLIGRHTASFLFTVLTLLAAPSAVCRLVADGGKPRADERRVADEADLLRELAKVPELSLNAADVAPLVANYQQEHQPSRYSGSRNDYNTGPKSLLSLRPAMSALPFRSGAGTRIDRQAAATLTTLSRKLRLYLQMGAPKDEMN